MIYTYMFTVLLAVFPVFIIVFYWKNFNAFSETQTDEEDKKRAFDFWENRTAIYSDFYEAEEM